MPLIDGAGCVVFTLPKCGDRGLIGDFSDVFGAPSFGVGPFTGAVFDFSVDGLGLVVLIGDFTFESVVVTFT